MLQPMQAQADSSSKELAKLRERSVIDPEWTHMTIPFAQVPVSRE